MQPYAAARPPVLLLVALAFALAAPAPARQQQQPQQERPRSEESDDVLRVSTELIQTDATVIDRAGNFVDGLKAEQFELRVDGKVQPLSFFERISAGSLNETAQLAAARGRGAGGASAAGAIPLDRGRTIMVFLDDLHLSPASLMRTRKTLARFIEDELRQNDQMLVAAATGQVGFLQQLTDDRVVLRAAVARLTPRQLQTRDLESPQMSVVQAIAIGTNDPQVVDAFVDLTIRENPAFSLMPGQSARQQAEQYVRRRASSLVDLANSVASRTLDSLRGLVRASAQFPGRKILYFISDGFAVETRDAAVLDRLRRVTDAALRAGVVIYTVDARGLSAQMSDLQTADSRGTFDPSGRLAGSGLSETAATQDPLRLLAAETGGRAILNTNSLGAAISKTLKETSVYYLLAWRPERDENRGGRFRRIEVSVRDRPELSVLVQRGFYTSPPDAPAPAAAKGAGDKSAPAGQQPTLDAATRELLTALRAPLPRTSVPTALTLNYLKSNDSRLALAASVQVEIEATPPQASLPAPTDRAEFLLAVYDKEGKLLESFQRGVNITPRPGDRPAKTHSVTLTFQTRLQPGLYQVRAASRDPKNRRTGSDLQWIELPIVSRGNFTLSSIFLGGPPAPSGDVGADGAGTQVLVNADRRFAREANMRFLVYVYNAALVGGASPDVALQVQVFRDGQPVVTTPLRKIGAEGVADLTSIPYLAELPLGNLPSGRYTLQLTAIDRLSKTSATQRVKFVIG